MQLRPADLIRIVRDTSLGDWIYKSFNWAVPLLFFKADGTPVMARCDASGALQVAAAEAVADWGTGEYYTDDTTGDYKALPDIAARRVTLFNESGSDLYIRKAGSALAPMILADGMGQELNLVANLNEVELARTDFDSGSPSTITYHYEV